MKKEKTVKMKFSEDMFYNLDLIYNKGHVYEIPENMVERWKKRGGVIVDDAGEPVQVDADVAAGKSPVPDAGDATTPDTETVEDGGKKEDDTEEHGRRKKKGRH
jgi:hypothetical protein